MDFGLQFCLVRREVVDASFRLIQTSRAATVDINLPNCVASADPRGHIYIYYYYYFYCYYYYYYYYYYCFYY